MIFVVDDRPNFLTAFKAEHGDNVRTFSNPNEALIALLSERPSVLVTDVYMPLKFSKDIPPQGMDGLKLAQIVSTTMPETQIIVISGNERSEIEKKYPGQLDGIKYFFNKPLDEEFRKTLKELSKKHNFTEVSIKLKASEVEKLQQKEGYSLSEKALNVIRRSL